MATQKQVERQVKVKRITRGQAANQVVAEMGDRSTLGDLAKKADELFVAGGGDSRIAAALWDVKRVLETAEAMGLGKLTRPTDIIVEKAKR